jgi:hypothetical protein
VEEHFFGKKGRRVPRSVVDVNDLYRLVHDVKGDGKGVG